MFKAERTSETNLRLRRLTYLRKTVGSRWLCFITVVEDAVFLLPPVYSEASWKYIFPLKAPMQQKKDSVL